MSDKKSLGQNLMTVLGMKTTKAKKYENQAMMTWFCTRNKLTLFLLQFLLFFISMTQKCLAQNFISFSTKTRQTCKPTENDLVLPPKLLNMIFWIDL